MITDILSKQKKLPIPDTILDMAEKIKNAGFEAYLVGGCVRDLILNRKPQDWDIATNALPEQIMGLFKKTFYENLFGTVGVVSENVSDQTLKVVEITPYRTEGKYSDSRRPDRVTFGITLEKDLSRRDFTINAIALEPHKGHIVDPYKGQKDIKDKIIRAVEDPRKRFREDSLRILRAIRISAELGFYIEDKTKKAIKDDSSFTRNISKERIRDEFTKMIMSSRPTEGLILSQELGVLKHFLPELEKTIGVKQNKAHAYDVWTHLLKSLAHSVKRENDLPVRLAVLFHDVGKPEARRWSEEKKDWTFYGHDVIGSRETERILKKLRFPVKLIDKVIKLVRWHMFFSDTEKITLSAVRRLVAKVGKENVWDLIEVRMCDRIGTGRPKESPYRLRKYQSMIEEVITDPISVSMLKIDGNKIMKVTRETSGPRVGYILHALLEEVLEDPTLNEEVYLENRVKELAKLPERELEEIGKKGKEKKKQEVDKAISTIRGKYWVK